MATHSLQHKDVQTAIERIYQFLDHYILLANAHATDFIAKDFWHTLLPENIQQELANLSETDLKCLSTIYLQEQTNCNDSGSSTYTNTEVKEQSSQTFSEVHSQSNSVRCERAKTSTNFKSNATTGDRDNDTYISSDNHVDVGIELSQNSLLIEWQHTNLREFCLEAAACTIEHFGLATSYEDVAQAHEDEKPFVGTFMNEKKSHEIERMAAVYNTLVQKRDSDLVIDFGSGKGYLGSYLSLQYDIPVLGIDAVSIHTTAAERRTNILTKQWNGLTRNKQWEVNKVSLTKKEKKLIREKKLQEATTSSVKDKTDERHVESKSNKYKPVTMFIENFTDLDRLVADNFPELCNTVPNNSQLTFINKDNEHEGVKLQPNSRDDLHAKFDTSESDVNLCIETQELSIKDQPCSISDNSIPSNINCIGTDFKPDNDAVDANVTLSNVKSILTGLHTCGKLASTSLELFVHSPLLTTLCNVGCCYHLLTEEFIHKEEELEDTRFSSSDGSASFPMSSFLKQRECHLGISARKLASQSVHRLTQSELQGRKLFPRALLEVLFHKQMVNEADRKGKSLRGLEQKCKTLHEFLTRACEKLDIMHKVDDKMITEVIEEFQGYEEKLAAFFQLRTLLAPCIESLIILDRACYLLEQDRVAEVSIVKMFDPVVSPRCYGIIATKT